jgi:phospholipid/cholesterol/gamma-HCH transport system permease protein
MSGLAKTWVDAFRGRGPNSSLDTYLETSFLYRPLETATEMVSLSGRVLKATFTPPFNWIPETVVEASRMFRLVTVPMMVASLVYVLAFGSVLFGKIVASLGAADRVGPGVYVGLLRELSTWLTFMILAGVVGSALAGDHGSRRIREELDALDVLGVDKLRTLVVPRVVAMMIVGLVLSFLVVLVTETGVILLDQATLHQNARSTISGVVLAMNPYDAGAALLKHTILGFFVGIVACQKGLSARGGAEGVGRAVNQTVVITFFGIWLINSLFNTGYLTIVPNALGIKG